MKEKHKLIILLLISICLGIMAGLAFGYITGIASSALGIVQFEKNGNE